MGLRAIAITLAVLALAGCGVGLVNREADAAARGLYDAVRAGTDLSRDQRLAGALRTPDGLASLAAARELIPKQAPEAVENRGWRFSTTSQGAAADLTHAYRYPDRTVVAETALRKPPGAQAWQIVQFRVRVEEADPHQRRRRQQEQPVRPDPALNPQRT